MQKINLLLKKKTKLRKHFVSYFIILLFFIGIFKAILQNQCSIFYTIK